MTARLHRDSEAGFSLIELAICLAIIGLVIGGVLMKGGDLLEKARLQSLIGQVRDIQQAALSYKDIHDKLPDVSQEETSFWAALEESQLIPKNSRTAKTLPSKMGGIFEVVGKLPDNTEPGHWLRLSNGGDKGLLTPAQALYLDKKLSDGNPSQGQVRSFIGTAVDGKTCLTNGQYNTFHNKPTCLVYIELSKFS